MSRSLLFYKSIVFVLTFFTYAALHSCRSVYSYSKDDIKKDPLYNYTSDFFGTCDLVFLLCYSFSLYLFGWAGDRVDLRLYLTIGMIGTMTSFGTLAFMRFSNYENSVLFVILMGMNGMFQSVGWPGCIALMGNWFGPGKRGLIMGIWAGNPNFGNIIGYEFGAIMIDYIGGGWKWAIICSIIFVGVCCCLLNLFVKPYPEKMGFKIYEDENNNFNQPVTVTAQCHDTSSSSTPPSSSSSSSSLSFFKAWTLPGVVIYTIGYTCTKSTAYGILFWLASYLKMKNMEENSSGISQVTDLGQFIGGLTLGILNDKYSKKALFMPFFLLLAAIFFILVRLVAGDSVPAYYILMFLCGFFLGGPFNIISSAIAADLSRNPEIKGNKKALSTVSGIIEGSGSLGAALIQKLIPLFEDQIFVIMAILCLIGGVVLLPTAYHEWKRNYRPCQEQINNKNIIASKFNILNNFSPYPVN